MKKILMVCLGNICRSPVAEGVMRKIAEEEGLSVLVDSAGTSNYHIGENPDRRSAMNAKKNGIDISMLKARQFTKDDFFEFDYILVMDESNYQNVVKLAPNQELVSKVDFLLNKIYPKQNLPVPDPYFGKEDGFEEVFQLVTKACKAFSEELKHHF